MNKHKHRWWTSKLPYKRSDKVGKYKSGDRVMVYGGDGHCQGIATLKDHTHDTNLWYVEFDDVKGYHFLRGVK